MTGCLLAERNIHEARKKTGRLKSDDTFFPRQKKSICHLFILGDSTETHPAQPSVPKTLGANRLTLRRRLIPCRNKNVKGWCLQHRLELLIPVDVLSGPLKRFHGGYSRVQGKRVLLVPRGYELYIRLRVTIEKQQLSIEALDRLV